MDLVTAPFASTFMSPFISSTASARAILADLVLAWARCGLLLFGQRTALPQVNFVDVRRERNQQAIKDGEDGVGVLFRSSTRRASRSLHDAQLLGLAH